MTTREFYTAIANAENLPSELIEKATELIAALDAKNEKRKTTETKEQKEAAVRRELVRNFFLSHPDEPFTRDVIADELSISAGQVSAAAKILVADGIITKAKAKVGKAEKVVYIHTTKAEE